MWGHSSMECAKVRAEWRTQMAPYTKASGAQTKCTVSANSPTQMASSWKVSGSKTNYYRSLLLAKESQVNLVPIGAQLK